MYRISKGDLTVTADTQAELQIAIACLTRGYQADKTVGAVHLPVEIDAPDWRVGGPRATVGDGKPALAVVPTESHDSDVFTGLQGNHPMADDGAPQHIPVKSKQLDVLEAVLLFPEGVPTRGVAQLLGLTDKAAGQRMQALKNAGLVELVPHSSRWRATLFARRAKLVRC